MLTGEQIRREAALAAPSVSASWWVNSNSGNDGFTGKTNASAFATIGKAISMAAVNDIIYVDRKHAENVVVASGIVMNKKGLQFVFLGTGSDRPTFTFKTATTASILISADNVKWTGFPICITTLDGMLNPIDITGNNFSAEIEWQDTSSSVGAVTAVRAVTVSNLNLNLIYKGFTAGSTLVRAISLNGVTGGRIQIDGYGLASVAWVNFVTVLSTNVAVFGTLFTQGITDGSRDVVDTITGSKWFVNINDTSAGYAVIGGSAAAVSGGSLTTVAANQAVPVADVTTNTNSRDVVGNKTDAAVTAVGTTKSIEAYVKGLVTMNTVQSADATNNAFAGDVVGNKTDAAVYALGTTKSLMAHLKGVLDVAEKVIVKAAATIVSGATQFTVAGGPIEILSLVSVCVTGNDGTASTLQWSCDGTDGAATTFSAASASLANALAGASVVVQGTALTTAPILNAAGAGISAMGATGIIVPAGIITTTVGVGSTTGTWTHHLRYRPLARGVTVV